MWSPEKGKCSENIRKIAKNMNKIELRELHQMGQRSHTVSRKQIGWIDKTILSSKECAQEVVLRKMEGEICAKRDYLGNQFKGSRQSRDHASMVTHHFYNSFLCSALAVNVR